VGYVGEINMQTTNNTEAGVCNVGMLYMVMIKGDFREELVLKGKVACGQVVELRD
jgi:hypothetical protein